MTTEERIAVLERQVALLSERIEDLEDVRAGEDALRAHGGKSLHRWEDVTAELDMDDVGSAYLRNR